jgi:hypothetical protein
MLTAELIPLPQIDHSALLEGATPISEHEVAFVNLHPTKSAVYLFDLNTNKLLSFEPPEKICTTSVFPTINDDLFIVTTPQRIIYAS